MSPSLPPTPQPPRPESLPGEAELYALFAGKRLSERLPCHVQAHLEGARGAAACTVLDLSDTGALLQIDDPDFVAADQAGSMTTYLEMLQVHAKDGVVLAFGPPGRRLAAELVRFTSGSAGGEATRVGVRFRRPITPPEVQALRSGTPLPAEPEEPCPPPPPTHRPRRGVRLQGLLFLALKPELGPLCAGELVQLGQEHVTLRVAPGLGEDALRTRVTSGALYLSLLDGGFALHEATAQLAGVAPASDGALHLTLTCRGAWSADLLRRLTKAS